MRRRRFLQTCLVGTATGLGAPSFAGDPGIGGNMALILVGASWCPFCKQAAPVLAFISERQGVPVMVASQDGKPISPIDNTVDARTHPIASSIIAIPTTLLYSSRRDDLVGMVEGYRDAKRYIRNISNLIRKAHEAGHV